MNTILTQILKELESGNLEPVYKNVSTINDIAMELYNKPTLVAKEIEALKNLLYICNIMYNDTDRSLIPIEDGVYDLLLEKYKTYDKNFQIGSKVIHFNPSGDGSGGMKQNGVREAICFLSDEDKNKINNLKYFKPFIGNIGTEFNSNYPVRNYAIDDAYIEKRLHNTSHEHPELIGTLC